MFIENVLKSVRKQQFEGKRFVFFALSFFSTFFFFFITFSIILLHPKSYLSQNVHFKIIFSAYFEQPELFLLVKECASWISSLTLQYICQTLSPSE